MGGEAADELVDVLDDAGRVIATVTRTEMRARRLRHRAVFVLVVASDGRLLVHRRSEGKDVWPGWWDLAAGGVLRAGEDGEAAARREIAEELGVTLGELELVAEGAYRDESVDEVASVYRARHDGPFHFADGEIVEARFLDRPALDALIATGVVVPDSLALVPLDAILPPGRRFPRIARVQELEFTVEPFVEGQPGPHVQAAVDAAAAGGAEVEFGPFGSTCRAPAERMPDIVAAVTRAAFANGATHVSLHVAVAGDEGS